MCVVLPESMNIIETNGAAMESQQQGLMPRVICNSTDSATLRDRHISQSVNQSVCHILMKEEQSFTEHGGLFYALRSRQ